MAVAVFSCVPRNQYDAVNAELNYYRSQAARADSLESQAAISTYNNNNTADLETQRMIREVEALRATNISLNQSFKDLSKRFDEQVKKNIELTQVTGSQVSDLQQSLADRKAEISKQEEALRAKEIQIYEREQELAAISPEVYNQLNDRPAAYNSQSSPLNQQQQTAVQQNQLQAAFRQALGSYSYTDVRYGNQSDNDVILTLSQSILFSNGYQLSDSGQALIGRIASVLQRYPNAEIRVVGHSHATRNPVVALENSTDRAIAIAQMLVSRGVNSRNVLAGGQGYYNPLTNDNSISGQATNRRTDIVVILP